MIQYDIKKIPAVRQSSITESQGDRQPAQHLLAYLHAVQISRRDESRMWGWYLERLLLARNDRGMEQNTSEKLLYGWDTIQRDIEKFASNFALQVLSDKT